MDLTFTTAGESHGPGLTAIVEGMPAGLELDREGLDRDMARRQLGHGRGGRMKIETDAVEIRSGVRHGRTLGSPIAVLVANRDYANWEARMNPWPVDAEVVPVHLPRPGHADLAGIQKYGHDDIRNVLERASARETAARVAAGALARPFLAELGVELQPRDPDRIGHSPPRDDIGPEDFAGVDESPVRCLDKAVEAEMVEEINRLRKQNESLGGTFEVRAFGLIPGLGSHDLLAGAARRPDRAGDGLDPVDQGRLDRPRLGSRRLEGLRGPRRDLHSDERGYRRETNRAGGLEGGMTNGEPLLVQVAIKPISTLTKPLRSVDIHTKEPQARTSAPTRRSSRRPRWSARRCWR